MTIFSSDTTRTLVRMALREDAAFHDVTTQALIPPNARGKSSIIFRQEGIVCGLPILPVIFKQLKSPVKVRIVAPEGALVQAETVVAEMKGPLRAMLSAERTALNFIQRLSGIATLTHRFVERARGTRAKILDTRKTTPGWRLLEKAAVLTGGGANHRLHLADAVMIKDNHLSYRSDLLYLAGKIRELRRRLPKGTPIEIEAQTDRQALAFCTLDIDILMLDNFPAARLKSLVRQIRGLKKDLRLEASGGVTLQTVAAIARSGVDWISIGALTHSAPACNISMETFPV